MFSAVDVSSTLRMTTPIGLQRGSRRWIAHTGRARPGRVLARGAGSCLCSGVVLRWLLPMIAAIAVLSSSVMTWAAAGVIGKLECCCPVKTKCKCHDHDERPGEAPTLKSCEGKATFVAPALAAAVVAAPVAVVAERQPALTAPVPLLPVPADRSIEPETPPF